MTLHARVPHPLPLRTDAAALGLRRVDVPTSYGEVAVRVGRECGGPATILLHGAAASWTTWTPLIVASDLAGQPLTDVVAIDLPGWGESGDAALIGRVEDLSDAVTEVARALGYTSWQLIGHSLGGFVALDVAARYPRATLGVTIVSASGAGVLDAIRRPVRGGIRLPGFAGMLLIMRALAALGAVGPVLMRLAQRFGWLRTLAAPLFAGTVHPSVVAALGEEVRPRSFARAAGFAGDYAERTWTAIRCPVRSIRGTRDVFAGEVDAAAFVELIPDFTESRLPDVGHYGHIERVDAVLDALRGAAVVSPSPAGGFATGRLTAERTRSSRYEAVHSATKRTLEAPRTPGAVVRR